MPSQFPVPVRMEAPYDYGEYDCNSPNYPFMCTMTSKLSEEFAEMPEYAALNVMGLPFVSLKANDSRWSVAHHGDDVLADIRAGRLDLTDAGYAPRSGRLFNISIISTPFRFYRVMAIVNRHAAVPIPQHDWSVIFSTGTWVAVLIWLFFATFVLPKLTSRFRRFWSISTLLTLSALFCFYFQNLFMQSLVMSLVVRVQTPFSTFAEVESVLQTGQFELVFDGYYPGWWELVSSQGHPGVILNGVKVIMTRILAKPNTFTMLDEQLASVYLKSLNGEDRERVYVYPMNFRSFAVSFCRKGFEHNEKLTLGYLAVLESGHNIENQAKYESYLLELYTKPIVPAVEPTPFRTIQSDVCYFYGSLAACLAVIFIESLCYMLQGCGKAGYSVK